VKKGIISMREALSNTLDADEFQQMLENEGLLQKEGK